MTKSELRSSVKKSLSLMGAEQKAEASGKCCLALTGKKEFLEADIVLSYMASVSEADPLEAGKKALLAGKTLAFPRCIPGTNMMDFRCVRSLADLDERMNTGEWGITEPDLSLPLLDEEMMAGKKILAVVPGLAFTSEGARLGHGKGYYDSYLARLRENPSVTLFAAGFCFSCQMAEEIPVESHDIRMDFVIHA